MAGDFIRPINPGLWGRIRRAVLSCTASPITMIPASGILYYPRNNNDNLNELLL
jgi:hypothetical protein